jgi:hypothetical protein
MKTNTISKLFSDALKKEIEGLLCETHPKVCELRAHNLGRLRRLVITEILSEKHTEVPSIQTALANLETEL